MADPVSVDSTGVKVKSHNFRVRDQSAWYGVNVLFPLLAGAYVDPRSGEQASPPPPVHALERSVKRPPEDEDVDVDIPMPDGGVAPVGGVADLSKADQSARDGKELGFVFFLLFRKRSIWVAWNLAKSFCASTVGAAF